MRMRLPLPGLVCCILTFTTIAAFTACGWKQRTMSGMAPSITLEQIPVHERARRATNIMLMQIPESIAKKVECFRLAMNPLVLSADYCRARVTNPSPLPMRLYHVRSTIHHESGRALVYRNAFEAYGDAFDSLDSRPRVATIPPHGEAEITVDLFGFPPEHAVILPGHYEIRAIFHSADSAEEYTASPVTVTLSEEQIKEYRRGY